MAVRPNASSDIIRPDFLVGHSFGTSIGEGSVNQILAQLMIDAADGRPMVADRTLVDAVPGGDDLFDYVVEGQITNTKGRGLGTWGASEKVKEYADAYGLHLAEMYAQDPHIKRVMRYAKLLGLSAIRADNLPTGYDPDATTQPWVRNGFLFRPMNFALTYVVIKPRPVSDAAQ